MQEKINLNEPNESLERELIRVSQSEAISIFEHIMDLSAGELDLNQNHTFDYIYTLTRKRDIDFNYLLKQVPPNLLQKDYSSCLNNNISHIYSRHYTFLNALVLDRIKLPPNAIEEEAMNYVVANSWTHQHASFDLYLKQVLGIAKRPSQNFPPIKFAQSTIDIFLNNHNWNTQAREKILVSTNPNSIGYPTLFGFLESMAVIYQHQRKPGAGQRDDIEKFLTTLFTQEQIGKMIDSTTDEDFQEMQRFIFSMMSHFNVGREDLNERNTRKLISRIKFDTRQSMAQVLIYGIQLMSNGESGIKFLNLCDEIHGTNWAENLFNKKMNLDVFINNLDIISIECLTDVISKNYGDISEVREIILKDDRAQTILTQYEANREKDMIEREVGVVADEMDNGNNKIHLGIHKI